MSCSDVPLYQVLSLLYTLFWSLIIANVVDGLPLVGQRRLSMNFKPSLNCSRVYTMRIRLNENSHFQAITFEGFFPVEKCQLD